MALAQLTNIEKTFGKRVLFDKLSLTVYPGERIGFIGANGAGKSTLFKVLTGHITPDQGTVAFAQNTKVGHHIKSRADATVVRGSTILDGTITNAASYQIELPEGGSATIENNTLVKGQYSSNSCCSIALGFEQYKGGTYVNPVGPVVIRNNKFTNQRTTKTNFVSNRMTSPASLSANTLTGLVTALTGNGTVNGIVM